ncbi:MAG: hypothetical protein JWQ84_3287 [Mucilaginibacter sp.]|nr:hypothetical protein [Mucilaginibacter sp.]
MVSILLAQACAVFIIYLSKLFVRRRGKSGLFFEDLKRLASFPDKI